MEGDKIREATETKRRDRAASKKAGDVEAEGEPAKSADLRKDPKYLEFLRVVHHKRTGTWANDIELVIHPAPGLCVSASRRCWPSSLASIPPPISALSLPGPQKEQWHTDATGMWLAADTLPRT